MKRPLKSILVSVATVALLFTSLSVNNNRASANTKYYDLTSKALTGNIEKNSKSYSFQTYYPTDFLIAGYVGNDSDKNETYANDYVLQILNSKNEVIATSRKTSFYNQSKKQYFIYQLIDQQLPKGKYILKLKIKDDFKSKQKYTINTQQEIIGGNVSITSFKANKKTPQKSKSKITLTTNAKGNFLQYQYLTRVNNEKKSKVLKKYSSKNKVTWIPTKKGTYKLTVIVKNTKSMKTSQKTITYKIK